MVDEIHTKKFLNTELFSFILLVFWGISIGMVCYLSLTPRIEFLIGFRWNDVIYHFSAYWWLSILPCIGFRSIHRAWIAALLMIPLGIGLEFGQHFMPMRVFSLVDIAANTFGVLIGTVCGFYLRLLFIQHARFGV
jgi:hypothetical protein